MRTEGNAEIVVAASGSTVPATLTDVERTLLVACEAEVDSFLRRRATAWEALWEIQTKRLYRETHSTFAAYLKDRFDITPSYASRLRAAGAVVEEARRLSPDVAHGQPPAERAIREINDLPVEEAAKVLVAATEAARAEGREVAVVADVRKARTVVVPEVESESEEVVPAYTWPTIARTIKPFLDDAVDPADRTMVLVGLADLRHDLLLEWGRADEGPLEGAIRSLEHFATRPDEEFRQHHVNRKDGVEKLERLLCDYRQRARRLEEKDRKVAALVPGSIWQRPARSGYRYLHVDRVDEKGIVSFRSDDAPNVVARQKREAFLEKATISSFDYNRDAKRRGEKVRAMFAAATVSPETKALALEAGDVDSSAPHGLSCARCGGTGPIDGKPEHRAPCVPEAK